MVIGSSGFYEGMPFISIGPGLFTEAIRWEWERRPGGAGGRGHSVPPVFGLQCSVQSPPSASSTPPVPDLFEVTEMLRLQQEQLDRLRNSIVELLKRFLIMPLIVARLFVDSVGNPAILLMSVRGDVSLPSRNCLFQLDEELSC